MPDGLGWLLHPSGLMALALVAMLAFGMTGLGNRRRPPRKPQRHPAAMTRRSRGRSTVVRKPLLSPWERAAMPGLVAALPAGLHLCPQVRLADMLIIPDRHGPRGQWTFRDLASLSVDFAVIDRSGVVVVVIELNDRTHGSPTRTARDTLVRTTLADAGIPLATFTPGQRLDVSRWTGGA